MSSESTEHPGATSSAQQSPKATVRAQSTSLYRPCSDSIDRVCFLAGWTQPNNPGEYALVTCGPRDKNRFYSNGLNLESVAQTDGFFQREPKAASRWMSTRAHTSCLPQTSCTRCTIAS